MIAILIVTVTAFLLAIFIVFIANKFKDDRKEEMYERLLPGYNCGVCGYGTCIGLAKEMTHDVTLYKKCKPLRGEALKEMEAYLRGNKLL